MQKEEVVWKVVEAYKASEECCQEKLLFIQPAYVEGMDHTQRRILKCHSNLNLDFLDEDKLDDDVQTKGAPTSRVGMARAEWDVNTLPI